MLILLISYLFLNLFARRKRGSKGEIDIDGNEVEMREGMADLREKIERLAAKLKRYIPIIFKGVAWLFSAVFALITLLLFCTVLYTIFEPEWLTSTTIFETDLLQEITQDFSTQEVIHGMIITVIPLLFITYFITVLLLKRRLNRWFIFCTLEVWIALLIWAVI